MFIKFINKGILCIKFINTDYFCMDLVLSNTSMDLKPIIFLARFTYIKTFSVHMVTIIN